MTCPSHDRPNKETKPTQNVIKREEDARSIQSNNEQREKHTGEGGENNDANHPHGELDEAS